MAFSAVSICNMALGMVRGKRIASFENPQTEEELWCSVYFEPTVDEVLRAFPWNCALYRQKLARLSTPPITTDWAYQYQLPQNPYCLRVLGIPDSPGALYKIEGRTMLTNEASVNLLYIRRLTDPATFDADLAMAVALRLASLLAIPIANSQERANTKYQEYRLYMQTAKSIEKEESYQPDTDDFEAANAGRQ